MGDGLKLAVLVLLLFSISVVAGSLGLTTDTVDLPTNVPEPDDSFLGAFLAPLRWVWTAVVSFVALMTFQTEIPWEVEAFFTMTISSIILVFLVRIIRGGG